MSDERSKWIRDLAGEYIESWVPDMIAEAWGAEVEALESQLAAERERSKVLRGAISYALEHSHEDNHLMVLHWDAYERLQATEQENK